VRGILSDTFRVTRLAGTELPIPATASSAPGNEASYQPGDSARNFRVGASVQQGGRFHRLKLHGEPFAAVMLFQQEISSPDCLEKCPYPSTP
jgi:hypothetical protein